MAIGSGYNPGDVLVTSVNIIGSGYNLNFAPNFLSCSIVESIFTGGVTADIEVADYDDYLSKLNLQGSELVYISFSKPVNGSTTFISGSYTLYLNRVKNITILGTQKTKIYELECVSQEAITGMANQVQKVYNTQISSIISDIFSSVLQTSLPVDVEQTKGQRYIPLFNQRGVDAIEMLRKEAISPQNSSSNYMYFITQRGIHFKTIEQMLREGDLKTFKQEDSVGHSALSDIDTNILAWKVEQNMNAMNRAKAGIINTQVSTFNIHTNEYNQKTFNPDLNSFVNLGTNLISSAQQFKNNFPSALRTLFRVVGANPNINVGKSFLPEAIPNKMANLAQMTEQLMRMTVIGEPLLEAGRTIFCNVPEVINTTDNIPPEPQVSGRWLISKLEHSIKRANIRPRYLCNVECIKGAYQGA
jgi:hypothetical protein